MCLHKLKNYIDLQKLNTAVYTLSNFPFLSILIFLPLFSAILVLISKNSNFYRYITIVSSSVQLVVATILYILFDTTTSKYQFFEKYDWITLPMGTKYRLSIDYALGIDGFSLPLILLTCIIFLIAILASNTIKTKQKGYYSLILLLQSSVIGCFVSLDLFLFYLFFEFMLLPMYFLIGLWGGLGRERAALKFLLYTLFGSILILIVFIGLYLSGTDPLESIPETLRVFTFRIDFLSNNQNIISQSLLSLDNNYAIFNLPIRMWAFIFLMVGFMIKLPAFPFHTWLPEAHVEAPTPVSVILAAILLKIGAYGMIRIAFPIFPESALELSPFIAIFGTISIIYAAYCALAMTDLKKMIAYSSVSHMGFVLLGLAACNSEGISGVMYQLVSHGFISAALFLIVGVIYERTHSRNILDFKGLASSMPKYTAIVVVVFFASLGLPIFSGFIAEVLVFLGAFKTSFFHQSIPICATFGLILTAGYYLWTLQRMFFGKFYLQPGLVQTKNLPDISTFELILFIPLLFFILILGIFPNILTIIFNVTVENWLSKF